MPARPTVSLDEFPLAIASKFNEAQSSLANHRKNCIALHKLHLQASKVKNSGRKNDETLAGEELFGDVFIDMVNRSLELKKGVSTDRIVKFVGSYVKLMNEKIAEDTSKADDEETFASRFVVRLLEWLFQGFGAKNKVVRQRSVQFVAEMMASIGEIDESTYNKLREKLIERLCDKEPPTRAQAAVALSKLIGTENPEDIGAGEQTCLDLLLECAQYDVAAEVRRAALVNIPVTPETIPVITTRIRDTDTLTRKLAYSAVLEPKLGHPRHLTISQREEITKAGLGDREAVVRVAAGKMITKWLDIAMSEPDPPGQHEQRWTGDDGGVMKGFIKFLAFFDVVGPGEAVAVDAMLSVFTTKPALLDNFVFNDDYWQELTPESAVLARVFVDQCLKSLKGEDRLETASIPVVTAFAFHIQQAYNELLSHMQEMDLLHIGEPDNEESEAQEEELAKKELILSELLRIALNLDYMDEIGRRKIFSVVRDMLAHPHLPPGLIEHCVDVLCKILPSERELIRIVVEIILELRDDDDSGDAAFDDTFDGSRSDITHSANGGSRKERSIRRTKERHEMTAEEQQQIDVTDIRCLMLCIGMLERVDGPFEDNSTLEGILTDLIVPAVKRKELALREKGLVALGLCCLIARNMATNSFQLFLNQVQTAPEDLKLKVLQIVFDLLIMYDREFLGRSNEINLDSEESPVVQCVLCIGFCKLLLSGQIVDSRVLLSLVLTYISPSTMDNAELKQCLSYFFPVYCYSSRENQNRMRSIFIQAFDLAARLYEQFDDEQKEDSRVISLNQFGLLMVDWTDLTKLLDNVPPPKSTDRHPHADLAQDILLALYDSDRDDEARKGFCQFLGQLQLFSPKDEGLELDNRTLLKLNILIENLQEQCPFDDSALDRTFNRFKDRFRKAFKNRVEMIDPGRYVDGDFEKFYKEIGMEGPERTGEPEEDTSRGHLVASTEVDSDDEKAEDASTEVEAEEEAAQDNHGHNDETMEAASEREEMENDDEKEEEEEAEPPAEEQPTADGQEDEPMGGGSKSRSKAKAQPWSRPKKSKSKTSRKPILSDGEQKEEREDEEEPGPNSRPGSRNVVTLRTSHSKARSKTRAKLSAASKEGDASEDDNEVDSKAATIDVVPSTMKNARKRTRAAQRDTETEPLAEPTSPVRKKRATGTRGHSTRDAEVELASVPEVDRDLSPSPKPKARPKLKPRVIPKRGRGSRAVAAAWSGNASEEENQGDEPAEAEAAQEEEEEEEHQRDPSPSPKPRAKATRSSRAATRSTRRSDGSNTSKQTSRSSTGNKNTVAATKVRNKSREKAKGPAELVSKSRTTRTSRRRQKQEEDVERIGGFDSDI
ncbi:hypothetical protein D9757_004209 [Collybiopsis confluens]|uniref:Nuclear condensin complex subunit 3 C-terminal domain-containing protein n=1 Tax=Collybiopsis confluens TaxID=2823264 RepID=A0A8H5HU32_9AGAR|nr:hypothetical protein D9757_004209 [Collybiopsis confluens]